MRNLILFFIAIIGILEFSAISWAQECTPKVDYDESITCSDSFFVARNSDELDQYLSSFGLSDNKYKNLRIAYNVDRREVDIHSPCSIEIRSRTILRGDNICLDARKDIKISRHFIATSNGSLKAIAQNGSIFIGGVTSLTATDTQFLAAEQFRVRSESDIQVQGNLSASSTGSTPTSFIFIGKNSTLSANNLTLTAVRKVEIEQNSRLTVAATASLLSTGSDAFGIVRIRKNVRIEAQRVLVSAQNRAALGKGGHIQAVESINFSAAGCFLSIHSTLNAPSKTGNCLGDNANKYPRRVSISADSLVGPAPLDINFTATATDVDGSIASLTWDFGDGTQATGTSVSHTYSTEGTYQVTLVAADDDNAKVPAQVSIQAGGNLPPTASAGADMRVELYSKVALNGMGSSDPEGDTVSYSWQLDSSPTGSMAILAKPNTATPFFIADKVGDYTFSLVVSDERHSSPPDTVVITAFTPPNLAPTLNSIGNKTVALGSELKFTISGTDGDTDDTIRYQVSPIPLLANARFNGRAGEFVFRPKRNQVGTHTLTFSASDGKAKASEEITVTVTAPSSEVTSLSGRVLDTNAMTGNNQEIPIVAATVSILVNNTTVATGRTDAQGNFTLTPISSAESHVLKIDASTANVGPDGVTYADFIEPLHLIEGASNVISRPFFLPRIDMSSATTVTAGQATQVMNTNLNVELSIPADAIENDDGTTFTGSITVSEVPSNLAPVSLPEHLSPFMLITIQPAGIRFTTPATITFPNSDQLPSGAELDIYSVDPDRGVFVVTGRGRVSADGTKIETISGGIRGATWHFPSTTPPDNDPDPDTGNEDCENSDCEDVGSYSPIAQGFLLESHSLVSYRSLETSRELTLAYSSNSATHYPIVAADSTMPLFSIPRFLSARIRIGGEEKAAQFYTLSNPLLGNIRRVIRQKVFYDASDMDTGLYPYELLVTSHYPRSRVTGISAGKLMVVNQRGSDFGAGWSLTSHHQLYTDTDGDVMIRFGNSDLRRFLKQEDGSFSSPMGDYSTLKRVGDNYERVLKDGTSYTFNSQGVLQEVKDRNNNITLYCYTDNTTQLKYIEDPVGLRTHFTYNNDGRVMSIRDPGNRTTQLSYDGVGNLILITNPDNSTRSFQYDSEHRLIGQVRTNGRTSNYSYDGLGRLSGSISSDGATTDVNPIASDTVKEIMRGKGTARNPLTVMESENVQGSFTDRNGNQEIYKVNEFGATIERTDALRQTTKTVRDENNNPTMITDAIGRVTINEYDVRGNLISRTDQETGAVTRYTYESSFNQITSIENPKGDRIEFSYDNRGNLLSIRDPNGRVSKFTYNIAGQVETETDFQGNTTQFFYHEANGNLMTRVDPQGNVIQFTHDALGNILTSTDAKNNRTAFEYDVMNRVTKTIDAEGRETVLSYDNSGNILSVRDANSNTTGFSYDEENRLISKRDALGREETYRYDDAGNIIEQVDRQRKSIVFEYDALNRVVRKILGAEVVSYTYDAVGNLLTLSDDDSRLTYTYNSRNQVLSVSTRGSSHQPAVTLSYTYDLNGNRASVSTPFGNIAYSHDLLNRQIGLAHGNRRFSFSYDNNSRLIERIYPNGFRTQYSYDESSRLLGVQHKNSSDSTVAGFDYTYDKVGNRVQKNVNRPSLSLNSDIRYVYDSLNQLISATNPRPNMPMETFTYDGVGNRLRRDGETQDSTFNANNQLVDDKVYRYRYDLNGNLVERQHKANSGRTIYDWDRENRLIQIIEYSNGTDVSKRVSYRYDGTGRRVEKKVRGLAGQAETVRYVYDKEDIILEYNNLGETTASYLHGPGIDEPLSMNRNNTNYYYHQDGLNSVVMLTDASGTPVQQYAYNAYGSPFVYGQSGSLLTDSIPIENPYLYTGREYDMESGFYYYRARYYNPQVGRFLSEDPIGFTGGEYNLYRYVGNNPINLSDPTGTGPLAYALCLAAFGINEAADSLARYYVHTNNATLYQKQIENLIRELNELDDELDDRSRDPASHESDNSDCSDPDINNPSRDLAASMSDPNYILQKQLEGRINRLEQKKLTSLLWLQQL